MPRPNTFVVGAIKSGTTSMHDYLNQHPDCFMSRMKEPGYFNTDMQTNLERRKRTLEQYLELFEDADGAQRIGESTVWYLVSEVAARNIKQFDPNAKIIIILRDPVSAMYSLHGQLLWSCTEDIVDFEEALAAEEDRRQFKRIPPECTSPEGLQYTRIFQYAQQVRRYQETFDREQLQILLFDEFVKETPRVYAQTLAFLGLKPFEATFEVGNPVKPIPVGFNKFFARRPRLRKAVHAMVPGRMQKRLMNLVPFVAKTVKREKQLDSAVRQRLIPTFAEDVKRLQDLIGRDLSHWLR